MQLIEPNEQVKSLSRLENRGNYVNVLPNERQNEITEIQINDDHIKRFNQIFKKYQGDKTNLTERLKENEKWYRQQHWDVMRKEQKDSSKDAIEPKSGHLFNCIANKHADMMDAYPSPNILPREESDIEQAKLLSSIIPVILEQNNFRKTYSINCDEKNKSGTGVYGVFWDKTKHNGIGDIAITDVDLMNLFWESGIKDIQKSPYLFHVRLENNDVLENLYPQLKEKLTSNAEYIGEYEHDDNVSTENKSLVFDCYYKKLINNTVTVHLCTYCNDVILYASENDKELANRGIYDHGLYPFHFDVLHTIKGSPAGFGIIDRGKDTQSYIDRTDQAILKNLLANVKPRYIASKNSNINPEDFADLTKDIVFAQGPVDRNQFVPIEGKGLSSIYVTVHNNKIEELKETTGNRDVTNGGTTSGVTAAAGIAALQEASGKTSRDSLEGTYNVYKDIILMIIELIRQFYTVPRSFRVLAENGAYEYITDYTNSGIKVQTVGEVFGGDSTLRCPLFDVEVTAQKQSPYSKLSQNELALQFYGAGFFNPQLADQALACLDMMDFDRKSFIVNKITQNGTLYQKLIQTQQMLLNMAQIADSNNNTNYAEQVAAIITGSTIPPLVGGQQPEAQNKDTLGGSSKISESSITKKARQQTAETTTPR